MVNLIKYFSFLKKTNEMSPIFIISSNKSFEEWEVFFANLTDQQFNKMGGDILDFVADSDLKVVNLNNFEHVVTCHLAFAKYALEAAHFQRGLAEHKRIALEGMAKSYQSAGMALQKTSSDSHRTEAYCDAWDALVEYCNKYGYHSDAYVELCNVNEYNFFKLP